MTTALQPTTVRRLGFIRLLYDQGVQQSRLPEPFNFPALLAFHDSVELFLVLVGDHIDAQLDRNTHFLDYWNKLKKADNSVSLTGQPRMRRLNDLRNSLKHAGQLPPVEELDNARTDVTAFFGDNVPRVFPGLSFDSIDMTDVIPQNEVRGHAKKATERATSGARALAMVSIARAYGLLMQGYTGRGFGRNLSKDPFIASSIDSVFRKVDRNAGRIGTQLGQVAEAVPDIQDAMRVMALGLDFNQYLRFQSLLPKAFYLEHEAHDEKVAQTSEEHGMVPDQDEFQFCHQFLVTAALRVAAAEAHRVKPSWQRGT
ncbi:hypothetical protein [Streptomyces mirabilis]|uniref:hypothetical protein n=1 Tax=Streptomyces mirabilis TaxID=68239 RepID=UPI0036A8DBA2